MTDPLAFMRRHAARDRLQTMVEVRPRAISRWALEFRSRNSLDGERAYIVTEESMPVLFHTRQQARDYAKQRFGYIRDRSDLRTEPHGWQMPAPIKVSVEKRGRA